MARLDQIEDVGPRLFIGHTEMKASDYMRTKVFHGFIDDTVAEHAIPQIGASQVMWGSDFPHIRSIGLEAKSALQDMVGFLTEDDQNKVVGGKRPRSIQEQLVAISEMECAEGPSPFAGSLRVSLRYDFYPLPGQEGG